MYINERVARLKAQETEYYLIHHKRIAAKIRAYQKSQPYKAPKKEAAEKAQTLREWRDKNRERMKLHTQRANERAKAKRAEAKQAKVPKVKDLEKHRTYQREYHRLYRRRKKEEAAHVH